MNTLEESAKQLIDLKLQLERIQQEYTNARHAVHNSLSTMGEDSIEIEGYRIARAKPYKMKTYSRDSVANGLRSILGLSDEQVCDVLVASQNEVDVWGDVVIRKLNTTE
jgi:hypothetical protein